MDYFDFNRCFGSDAPYGFALMLMASGVFGAIAKHGI